MGTQWTMGVHRQHHQRVDMASKKELSPAQTDALLRLDVLTQQDLERLITAAYRIRGYDVRTVKSADQHEVADLLLTKDAQRLLLQCKYWKTRKVGEMPVRELYGSMAAQSATGGVMVSSGVFSLEATRFANFAGIELLDASKLRVLLQRGGSAEGDSPQARTVAG
jgi:restriction system protein